MKQRLVILTMILACLSLFALGNPLAVRRIGFLSGASVPSLTPLTVDYDVMNITRSIALVDANPAGAAWLDGIPATVFDSYCAFNRYPCTELNFGTGAFTVNLWVRFTSYGAYDGIITRGTTGVGGGWRVSAHESGTAFIRCNTPQSAGFGNFTASPIDLNQWIMLTFVRNGTVGTGYYNGGYYGTRTHSVWGAAGVGTYDTSLEIGRLGSASGAGNYFNGAIRNVSIHNDDLSVAEIAALYAEGIVDNPTLPDCVSFYRLKPN